MALEKIELFPHLTFAKILTQENLSLIFMAFILHLIKPYSGEKANHGVLCFDWNILLLEIVYNVV